MANLSKVIYINEVDYSTLLNGGTITKGGVTYSHDPTALYVIKNVSAPEYAETAGYATTAGQATKATQDGDGNVISETYEKEQQVIIEFDGNDTTFPNLTDPEVRALCNDNSKTVILKDTSLRSQSTEGFPLYYRTEFTTDHWAFSSTYVEAAGAGWLIRLCWDQNREAIVREFSDTKLYPSENVDLGQAYGVSSNNSNATRTSSISGFKLKRGGIVAIKFTTDIDITNPSLNISSTGSKPIYYRGSALPRGTVNAGDTVTFIYDGTYYHIISIDKDIDDAKPLIVTITSSTSGNNTTYSLANGTFNQMIAAYNASRDIICYYDGMVHQFSYSDAPSTFYFTSFQGDEGSYTCFEIHGDNDIVRYNGIIPTTASSVGADVFVVNIEGDNNDGYTCDKTNAEIYAAWQAGRCIICVYNGYHLLLNEISQTDFSATGFSDEPYRYYFHVTTVSGVQSVYCSEGYLQPQLISGTNIKTINNQSLLGSGNLTANDIGAITRFVVDFTLSGTTISNPNKTFLEIKAAYDAGNLVLAKDDTDGLYYLLYCEDTGCGFFCCDSGTLYDIRVDSSDTWTYLETNISQLGLDLSDKSQIIYMQKVSNDWRKVTYNNVTGTWSVNNTALTTGNIKNIYLDKDNNDLYYWDGSAFILIDEDNVQPDWNQSDSTKADYIKNKPVIPNSIKVGSVAGKLYRNDVNGGGNFTVKGNSGCIPNIIAGTFLVSIYAKSTTQSYTFKFNFGSVSYNLSTTNGEINDTREITIPSDGTFSGSVLNGSVASGTILYVVMYNYLTPVSTVGVAAVTNRYSDLDGTPTIPTVNNGTLTIQQNGITAGTFTANQSSNTTANIYSTMFGTLGQSGFERDNYNSSTGNWEGVEIVTPNPLVTYVDILSDKLYRYDPITTNYVDLGDSGSGNITSTAITDLTDIL